ncbi:MAG: hypothetical protein JXA71_14325, partial [Chitinispirillaceae bacterium]|nr:hypothetical protein [Chitinispirillaceae bacterium]
MPKMKEGNMRKLCLSAMVVVIIIDTVVAGVIQQTGEMVLSDEISSVSCNSIKLPITLSYKSGIKTNQRASWAGLGFDLDVPYVERIAIGCADEKSYSISEADKLSVLSNGDCVQPGVIDLAKVFDRLLTPATNGYQGEYMTIQTCPGTDYADGYTTEMNEYFQSMMGGNCNIAFTVDAAGEIKATSGFPFTIGTTDRQAGTYTAGTLCMWLGSNCGTPSVSGVAKRQDFKYNNLQDIYILNAPFGNGRIVFTPPSQSMTLSSGKTFTIYSQAAPMSPHLQNNRKIKIAVTFGASPIPGDNDPDITSWVVTDENGTEYVFN